MQQLFVCLPGKLQGGILSVLNDRFHIFLPFHDPGAMTLPVHLGRQQSSTTNETKRKRKAMDKESFNPVTEMFFLLRAPIKPRL